MKVTKSKVMRCNRNGDTGGAVIVLNSERLEKVQIFQYFECGY